MQVLFRHAIAAIICATVAFLGGISASVSTAATVGALISLTLLFLEGGRAARVRVNAVYAARHHYNNRPQPSDEDLDMISAAKLFRAAIISSVFGLPIVKDAFWGLINYDYTLAGTPWWRVPFFIFCTLLALCILSSGKLREAAFGSFQNQRLQSAVTDLCAKLAALAGLLYLALGLTATTVQSPFLAFIGVVGLSITFFMDTVVDLVRMPFYPLSQRLRKIDKPYCQRLADIFARLGYQPRGFGRF